ncbi:dipicolinate synthase subunit A [Pueribacillus theae]|uniref:Dipicolinate synthase subunit A n=1 Tax=Pueribacillus theae TaxID=2171751 RepID=A0A2U1K889_9BACI|nr:dipicolinic acid synthetase subunit A [Pueribacillus theae]PWA13554.1 dipicolinate synthase subunit A [Pueribacillus theae]
MLTDLHITILGGDARQIEIIRKLTEMDATVTLVGFDHLDHGFAGATQKKMRELDLKEVDAIVLPVSGTSENGEVETTFSKEKIFISEKMLESTPEHCVVYTGISNKFLDLCAKRAGRKVVKLFERDDVAIYNSIPTVEGTIMMAIENTDITIHNSKTLVLGFGRTGMSVARAFDALGAKVKVGTVKSADMARISEMGLQPFHLNDLQQAVIDSDIIINTIPALVLKANIISKMPMNALIIDLASKPGGTDFRYAEKRGIKALLAPGLPGIVAPKTAGKIIANVLVQQLSELNTS